MALSGRVLLICLLSGLFTLPRLSWGQVAGSQLLVNEPYGPLWIGLHDGYAYRLEAQLPYQQALLPKGVTSSETYWVHQGRRFSLVTADVMRGRADEGRAGGSTSQEFNSLDYINGRWRTAFRSAYGESLLPDMADNSAKLPATHNYLHSGYTLTSEHTLALEEDSQPQHQVVHKNFDPLRLLEGRPPSQPDSTCFFYVLDFRPDHLGDTLLSYHLHHLPEGTYHLEVCQRIKREQPRWLGNNHVTQTWEYDARARTLLSKAAGGHEWRRQYGAGKNFVEVLTQRGRYGFLSTYRKPIYTRRRTYTAGRALDRYTVSYLTAQEIYASEKRGYVPPTGKVTFTIVTDFR